LRGCEGGRRGVDLLRESLGLVTGIGDLRSKLFDPGGARLGDPDSQRTRQRRQPQGSVEAKAGVRSRSGEAHVAGVDGMAFQGSRPWRRCDSPLAKKRA
jgi:hypothetical protein